MLVGLVQLSQLGYLNLDCFRNSGLAKLLGCDRAEVVKDTVWPSLAC